MKSIWDVIEAITGQSVSPPVTPAPASPDIHQPVAPAPVTPEAPPIIEEPINVTPPPPSPPPPSPQNPEPLPNIPVDEEDQPILPDFDEPIDDIDEISPLLLEKREKEFLLLKEAYGIIGDSWETAIGSDSIAQANLQKFKDRWEDILESKEYSTYNYYSGYGGYAPMDNPYSLLTNPEYSIRSGYIGGQNAIPNT